MVASDDVCDRGFISFPVGRLPRWRGAHLRAGRWPLATVAISASERVVDPAVSVQTMGERCKRTKWQERGHGWKTRLPITFAVRIEFSLLVRRETSPSRHPPLHLYHLTFIAAEPASRERVDVVIAVVRVGLLTFSLRESLAARGAIITGAAFRPCQPSAPLPLHQVPPISVARSEI